MINWKDEKPRKEGQQIDASQKVAGSSPATVEFFPKNLCIKGSESRLYETIQD